MFSRVEGRCDLHRVLASKSRVGSLSSDSLQAMPTDIVGLTNTGAHTLLFTFLFWQNRPISRFVFADHECKKERRTGLATSVCWHDLSSIFGRPLLPHMGVCVCFSGCPAKANFLLSKHLMAAFALTNM